MREFQLKQVKSNLVQKYNSRARKLSRATFSVKLVLTTALETF